ncbi:MAG: hypothetical protein NTV86_12755 [Planctomycetota bacterium]|nr:hypothetical protein [Planctomycetota bacterium]
MKDTNKAAANPGDILHVQQGRLLLDATAEAGRLTRIRLADSQTGMAWAEGAWDFLLTVEQGGKSYRATEVSVAAGPAAAGKADSSWSVTVTPRFDAAGAVACVIDVEYRIAAGGEWLEERFVLRNTGRADLKITAFRAMFSRGLADRDVLCFPVPFESCHTTPRAMSLRGNAALDCNRDGAVLLSETAGLVIARRPTAFEEEPRFVGVRREGEGFCFGGIARGVPEGRGCVEVKAGGSLDWGITRYTPFRGRLDDGLLQYRDFMVECGVKLPEGYSPPINYCIYYECGERYHHLKLLDGLKCAVETGCTLLYTDQGWEDYFGSGLWDETRLGKIEAFVQAARASGMAVGVLVGLHTDAYVWPKSYSRKDAAGNIVAGDRWGAGHWNGICPTVQEWQREKTRRLKKVVDAGVSFFSFDFNDNTEPCADPSHGHIILSSPWEHSLGVAQQQRMLKQACPGALIEAHDWLWAGLGYWPIYALSESHDERWGFEFMWDPFGDLKSGRLFNLYYYNLCYEKPLYLHIDLKKDSPRCVVFWYVASTVRHMGIGNYATLAEEQKAQVRRAVAICKDHQRFFSAGRFSGPDPLTHIHVLPGEGALVLRFNDQAQPVTGRLELTKDQVGCEDGIGECTELLGAQAKFTRTGAGVCCDYALGEYDVLAILIRPRA